LLSVVGQDLPDRTSRDQEIDVSTPGAGGPQPPEQDPSQPAQPGNFGQQPPAGQPWGAPQQPQQPWGAPQPAGPQGFGQPQQPAKPTRKWVPIVGGIVVLIVALFALTSFLGGGAPEVGDCIHQTGSSEYETVDCDSDDSDFKIVGIDEDMTGEEFDATDVNELCLDHATATSVLWYGTSNDEDGSVYCAEDA
jgi:hypothetical protein